MYVLHESGHDECDRDADADDHGYDRDHVHDAPVLKSAMSAKLEVHTQLDLALLSTLINIFLSFALWLCELYTHRITSFYFESHQPATKSTVLGQPLTQLPEIQQADKRGKIHVLTTRHPVASVGTMSCSELLSFQYCSKICFFLNFSID